MNTLKNNKTVLCLWILIVIPFALGAQTKEYGIWSGIGVTKEFGKWDLGAEIELRNDDKLQKTNRIGLKLELSIKVLKGVNLGASYEYLSFYDTEYSDYQPRQRYNLFLQGKYNAGRFSFSLRERVQRTIKDESDRIKESGDYDNYALNPEWLWRNRVKLSYDMPKCPLSPSFSFESFYQLNNPDGDNFSQLRYELSLNYKFDKHNQLEVFGLIDKEINVKNAVQTNVAGLTYAISF